MADNIIEKGVNWFDENVVEPVKDTIKDIKIEQIKDDYIDSFKDAVVSHDKLTPELIEQGWKEGLDGQPYNASLSGIHDPGGIYYDPDREDNIAAMTASAGGYTPTSGGYSGGVLRPQDLRQRTPSGTMYAPDLSAYEASSLFDYAGPGGLEEYTYGQGLPIEGAGYDIWGTPTNVPNPYYWGQFGEGYEDLPITGPADGAISLPPIDLPSDVPSTNNNPNVGDSTTNITTGSSGGGGHNYWSDDNQAVYDMMQGSGVDNQDLTIFGGDDTNYPTDYLNIDGSVNGNYVGTNTPYTYSDDIDNLEASILGDEGFLDLSNMAGSLEEQYANTSGNEATGVPSIFQPPVYGPAAPTLADYTQLLDTTPANSGLEWPDMGNNYDTGDALADSILGGEAYAQLVYNNDPIAEAIPGLLGNPSDFNLGRPDDSNYEEFNTVDTSPSGLSFLNDYTGNTGTPSVGDSSPQYSPLVVQAILGSDYTGGGFQSDQSYATHDLDTGEIVTIDPVENTVTPTGNIWSGWGVW